MPIWLQLAPRSTGLVKLVLQMTVDHVVQSRLVTPPPACSAGTQPSASLSLSKSSDHVSKKTCQSATEQAAPPPHTHKSTQCNARSAHAEAQQAQQLCFSEITIITVTTAAHLPSMVALQAIPTTAGLGQHKSGRNTSLCRLSAVPKKRVGQSNPSWLRKLLPPFTLAKTHAALDSCTALGTKQQLKKA
jgi:hypothetical protein